MPATDTTNMSAFLRALDQFLADRSFCPSQACGEVQDGHWIRQVIAEALQSPCMIEGPCQQTTAVQLLCHMRHVDGWNHQYAYTATVVQGGFPEDLIPKQ